MSRPIAAAAEAAERVLAPLGRRTTTVVANEETGAYRLLAALDSGGPMPAAGQFYMLTAGSGWGGEGGRPYLPRAFSVAAAAPQAEGVRLGFLLEAVGPGTAALAALGAGTELHITGPLGRSFSPPPGVNPQAAGAVLVGGGIGIAPLAILRETLAADGVPTRTLLGFRDRDHAGGLALFRCSEVGLASEDGHVGHRGYVTDLLGAALAGDDAASAAVYACGPPAMLEAVRLMCAKREVPCELALETPMACGFGACYGCAVPLAAGGYMRLCVDGPVVRGEEVATAMPAGSGHR